MKELEPVFLFLKKYLFPILLLFTGIMMLYLYLDKEVVIYKGEEVVLQQNNQFLIGAVVLLISAVISTLFIAQVINRLITYILFVFLIGGSVYVLYLDYMSVKKEVDWRAEKEKRYIEIKQRLEDIRDAQLAYKERFGKYAPTLERLVEFVKEGHIYEVEKEKSVPSGYLTREEMNKLGFPRSMVLKPFDEKLAWRLAQFDEKRPELQGFRRDTIKVPVMEAIFMNDKAVAKRINAPTKLEFQPDSLMYVPYSGEKFWMKTDSIERGEGKAPVFLAMDPKPFDEKDTLKIGSLEELKTNGNWSNR